MGLKDKIQNIGNPNLTFGQNIFSMFCFFVFGFNFLVFYNAVVNLGDLLATEFGDFGLDFMSTYPLFLNWFNFFFAFGIVVAAMLMKKFPYNLLIHIHFIMFLVLLAITPIVLNYLENDTIRFWVMVIITVLGGIPCQLSGGVVTSLAGLFSSTHNTIYLIGASTNGIFVSLFRMLSGRIFSDDKHKDYILSLYLNIIYVALSYILYVILYYSLPFTRLIIKTTQKKFELKLIELENKKMNVDEENETFNVKQTVPSFENSSSDEQVSQPVIHNNSFKYEESESSEFEQVEQGEISDEVKGIDTLIAQSKRIFKQTWVQLIAITIDYFLTFCVFAGIFLGIPYDESSISLAISQQVTTFCYMGGDAIARVLALIKIPWNKWVLLILSCLRGVFYVIIFIYYYGVYTNPYLMFFVMLVFSTTHGLFASASIGLCFAASLPKDMKMTANLCNLCLDLGLALGATGLFVLNLVLPKN